MDKEELEWMSTWNLVKLYALLNADLLLIIKIVKNPIIKEVSN